MNKWDRLILVSILIVLLAGLALLAGVPLGWFKIPVNVRITF